MTLTSGTRLGPYEIIAPIGAGGMGEVYKAKDLKLGREVAIKVLPLEMASDSQRLRRFEQEARAASALNHPNIVTIYEIGEHEGTPYIAMEYVDGVTLRETLAGGALPNDKLIRYASQMAEGLAKAHQARIVHRDLKPENTIISDDGYIKILDFGLAKLLPKGDVGAEVSTLARETTPGAILGTVGYMSPEQAKGEPADFRSDQFSLGAILFEMATGTRAFARESSAQTLAAIIEDDPQPVTLLNPSVSGHLAAVIDRCLSKKPGERFESTRDLAKEIHSETLTIPGQPSRRHPLAAAGVGGLLAIILVMIVGLFVSDVREWVAGEGDGSRIESIAVLPLENVSGDPEQEYFVDGMTEALITELARIGALKVISRTSAMRYKDSAKSAPEIAKELGVDALIEGSVLTSGGRVRIKAQLIDGATDQHLWAQSYEREFEDVLTLQREIALQIAGEVDASLTPIEEERLTREYQVDADSYDAYLRGDYRMFSDTRASADTIVRSLELAIELDPGFAPAYARLADFLSFLSMRGFMDPAQSYLDARRLAGKAVELDPSLAEARAALARVLFQYEWDWPAAEREFGQALELNPNDAFTLNVYGAFQVLVRADCEEGLSVLERAVELDPFNEFVVFDLGLYAGHCRRYGEAVQHLERVLALRPGLRLAEEFLAVWDSFNGSHEKALSRCESLASRLEGDYDSIFLATCGMVNARADRMRDARALLRQLENPPEGVVVDSTQTASVCAAMGDLDCALDEMEAAYEARAASVVFIRVAPFFDPLRDEPRFRDLLRRMNFPEP